MGLNGSFRVHAAQSVTAHGWRDACGTARAPVWSTAVATPEPIHVGGICAGGLGCNTTIDADRRLGDQHTNTITKDGALLIAFGETRSRPSGMISHPGIVRQAGGADFAPLTIIARRRLL